MSIEFSSNEINKSDGTNISSDGETLKLETTQDALKISNGQNSISFDGKNFKTELKSLILNGKDVESNIDALNESGNTSISKYISTICSGQITLNVNYIDKNQQLDSSSYYELNSYSWVVPVSGYYTISYNVTGEYQNIIIYNNGGVIQNNTKNYLYKNSIIKLFAKCKPDYTGDRKGSNYGRKQLNVVLKITYTGD